MKKYILLIMLLLVTTQAYALTANEYWSRRTYLGAQNRTLDPLYTLFDDVDGILGSSGELSTARILFTEETGDPTATEGTLYYNASSELLRLRKSGSWVNLAVGSGTVSLNVAYGNGVAITVDNGAVTLTGSDAASNVLLALDQNDTDGTVAALTVDSAGDETAVIITQTGSGDDIEGTADWSISATGVGTFLSFVLENGGIINNTENNEIEFSENSEQFSFAFNGNTLTYATDSGIDSIAFGVVDALSGIASIAGDTGADFALSAANTSTFNFTIAQTGTGDNELRLTSAGTAANAIALTTATGGITVTAADDFVVVTTDDVLYTVGDDLTISGATGSVFGIAANAAAQLVTIGNETGVSALHLLAGTGDIDIQGVAASTITIGDAAQTAAITIGASTATMTDLSLGTGVGAHTIHIGDGGTAAQVLTLGSNSVASSIDMLVGTGNFTLDGVAASTYTIGNAAQTGTMKIGESSATMILNLGTGVGAHTIHIGDGGTAAQLVTIGSTSAASAVTVQAGTGKLTMTSAGTSTDAIDIDTTAGGIDIDMSGTAAGEDFSITTSSSITFSTSEAVADQFKVSAAGTVAGNAINFVTSDGGFIVTAAGAENGDIGLDAADDITFTAGGDLTLAVTGSVKFGNSVISNTRTVATTDADSRTLTAAESGSTIIFTMTGAAATATLPEATASEVGVWFILIDGNITGGRDLKIDPEGTGTIDGAAAGNFINNDSIDTNGVGVIITCTAADTWYTAFLGGGAWSLE